MKKSIKDLQDKGQKLNNKQLSQVCGGNKGNTSNVNTYDYQLVTWG